MRTRKKVLIWTASILAAAGTAAALILIYVARRPPISLTGAVIARNSDPDKELPIAGVEITPSDGLRATDGKSDSLGFFRITLPKWVMRGHRVVLEFRHPGYQPLQAVMAAGDDLYVIRMTPDRQVSPVPWKGPVTSISSITVRYTVKATTDLGVGTQVKVLRVVNTGDVPCHGHPPCSPDGKWKAAIGSAEYDAGEGNVFSSVRVSCIAGPCPFTKVNSSAFSEGGRRMMVSASDWSDTATFLVEADVVHPMVSDDVRTAYPVIFGQALNFTVPKRAEGVSLEADVNGAAIVFPLGPDLYLPWASCVARITEGGTRAYRCELKPGYRFR
jgi:hypothetical protein